MENKAKTYTKYAVKRKAGTKIIEKNEGGSPVLGDVIKTNIRMTSAKADILNDGWNNREMPITFYYAEQEEKAEDNDRAKLFEEAKGLGLNPAKNIKTDKLIELIKEVKGE